MTKSFRLQASEIKRLVYGYGSCIASDKITVDGGRVGFMYREQPDNAVDSGWRFFSGEEDQQYADDASKFAKYDLNTIANYDPGIIPYLDAPCGSAYGRVGEGFQAEEFPADPD